MAQPGGRAGLRTCDVRLTLGDGGVLGGVVERVRSGEKQRFDSVATLAEVIAEMVARETTAKSESVR